MIDMTTIGDRLSLGPDGIWHGEDPQRVSYPTDGNSNCFQIEDSSFWFRHRNACIVKAVENFPPPERAPIFDIGGGNGFVSSGLMNAGFEAVLVEPGLDGALNGKRRGIPIVVCGTTESAGFKNNMLDAIGLFDVAEHMEDDSRFLGSIRKLLKAGGRLYISVPAYPMLWSAEDERAGHFRRYTMSSFEAVLTRSGFSVEYSTYIFRLLPVPILMLRAAPFRLGLNREQNDQALSSRDHQVRKGIIAGFLDETLRGEVQMIKSKKKMHFGSSCLAVAVAI